MGLVCRGCLLNWPRIPARYQDALIKNRVTSLLCEHHLGTAHIGKAVSVDDQGTALEALLLLCAEDDSVVEMVREWFATPCES